MNREESKAPRGGSKSSVRESVTRKIKNFARGQLGAANSRAYAPTFVDRRGDFEAGLRRVALISGQHLAPGEHAPVLAWLKAQHSLLASPLAQRATASYRALSNFYIKEQADFERQIAWTMSRIADAVDQIRSYERLFSRLEVEVLTGQTASARGTISEIEATFGATVRLAEVKLAFEQFHGGLEAQKKLASQMRGRKGAGLIGFLVYYVSMRNEPTVPIERYQQAVTERISRLQRGPIRDYVTFRLARSVPQSEEAIANILTVEEAHSVFDLFDTLRELSNMSLATGSSSALTRMRSIADLRYPNFQLIGAIGPNATVVEPVASIGLTYRRLLRSLSVSEQISFDDVKSLSLFGASLRSRNALSGTRTVLGTLIGALSGHLTMLSGGAGKNGDLAKLAINFCRFPLMSQLSAMVDAKRLNWIDPWLSDARGFSSRRKAKAGLTPLDAAPSNRRISILRAVAWFIRLSRDQRSETLLGYIAFAKARYRPLGIRLVDANISLALCKSLLDVRDYPPAWALISSLVIDDQVHIDHIPTISDLRNDQWIRVSKGASLAKMSVCIDLLTRPDNAETMESLKRYALEELLQECQVDRPSQLSEIAIGLSRKEYIYFLKNVCTPRSMELLPGLTGTTLVNSERRMLCSILLQIDRDNASQYNQEIINIIRRERLEHGLKLVDSSRIHVDTDVLQRRLLASLALDFQRYKVLVAAGVGVADRFEDVLRNIAKPAGDQELLTIPENEADDLLLEIIRNVRDRFLFDEMNGFDSYLGRRIRHNSMTGVMRLPVSQEKLITQLDNSTRSYERNSYWLHKFKDVDPDKLDDLDRALERFSGSFDAVGNDIKARLFQVKSPEHPEGIFQVNLSSNAYHLLRSFAQQTSKLEEFIATCFEVFWTSLADPLAKARHIIRRGARDKVSAAFTTLKLETSSLDGDSLLELTASIERSRDAVLKQLELIAGWFRKREISEQKTVWGLEEIVDICIEVCMASHRARNPQISRKVSGDILLGPESLFVLSDILWIAIDNACMHSGRPTNVDVRLQVSYDDTEAKISLDVENDVEGDVAGPEWSANIAAIDDEVQKSRANESLRVEGRSGLKKVAAIAFSAKGGECVFGPRSEGTVFGIAVTIPTVFLPGQAASDIADDADYSEMSSEVSLQ
jgi:hypothetical protein